MADLKVVPEPSAGADPAQGSSGDGGGDIRERLARLEERVESIKEHMAVKNDVTSLKVWILGGVLGGIGGAATITAIVVKAFF